MKEIIVTFEESPVGYPLKYNDEIVDLKQGQFLLVESSRGLELVKVVSRSSKTKEEKKKEESFKESIETMDNEKLSFIRIATQKDIETNIENKKYGETIKKEIKNLIKKYNLEMKVSGIRITLDKSKIVIYFTAENRIDFRELVKELANIFKTRIELRQIGSRDETRIMGGIGPCGERCCCKRFLNDFGHVSIKMAKNQNLSLNPNKISGICGRLLCCLDYENGYYSEMNKVMPQVNSIVSTPNGTGIVLYNDILKQTVQVKIGDENNFEVKTFNIAEIKRIKDK